MKPEAIVVGAGPAGCSTALSLARAGVNVVLVERSKLPREKACGDGLSPRALDLLSSLGIPIPNQPAINRLVLRTYRDPGRRAEFSCEAPWGACRRVDLDYRMADAAVRAGATLRSCTTAESLIVENGAVQGVRTRGNTARIDELRAPVTVLAEGSVGALLRQAPVVRPPGQQTAYAIRRYFENVAWDEAPAFEILLPIESGSIPLMGYAWVFPVGNGAANVGVGWLPDRTLPIRLRSMLSHFEEHLLQQDCRFAAAHRVGRALGAPLLIGASAAGSHAPGLLLVGDAAGLKNPFSAEGISKAIESGVLASDAILAWLGGRAPLSDYGRLLTERRLTHDQLVPGLPSLYRLLRHVSRDLVPFVRDRTAISAACFAQGEFDFSLRTRGLHLRGHPPSIERATADVKDRVYRLVYRERPFFGAVVAAIGRDPRGCSPCADALFAARAVLPAFDLRSPLLRRAAVCLELARHSAVLLDDLDVDLNESSIDGSRGGGWIAASIAISLGDQLLARCFAINAKLPKPDRNIVATAVVRIMERLTTSALRSNGSVDHETSRVIAAEAARAGALIGGASEDLAEWLALQAEEVSLQVPPDEFARVYLRRLDWSAPHLGAQA